MSIKNTYIAWSEAFATFAKYADLGSQDVNTEHDIIYAGYAIDNMEKEDCARLEELGWDYDPDLECWYRLT